MGRKYNTRSETTTGEEADEESGADRRVPAADRGRVQQRLSSAIEAARAEAPADDDPSATETDTEVHGDESNHEDTLDRMETMLDAEDGSETTEAADGKVETSTGVDESRDIDGTGGDPEDESGAGSDDDGGINGLFDDDDDGSDFFGESDPFGGGDEGEDSGRGFISSDEESETGASTQLREEVAELVETDDEGASGEGDGDTEFSDERVGGSYSHLGGDLDDSPRDSAHEYLTERAVADRYRSGGADTQRSMPPEEALPNRVGGWSEYDPEDAAESVSLDKGGPMGGRTKKYMDRVVLDKEADGTDTAFVTYYNGASRPSVSADPPRKSCAQNQMAMYAFCDAVGANVPRHTYNADEEWVAAYGVDGYSVGDIEFAFDDEEEERNRKIARNVDREEFRDHMAVQILGGNSDLHELNVHLDDDGGVHCIDLDLGAGRVRTMKSAVRQSLRASETAATIAETRAEEDGERDEEFTIEPTEIAERAQELAVSIHNSGDTDRIVDTVAEYDEVFDDVDAEAHEDIRNNIEMFVENARKGRTPQPLDG